MEKNRINFDIPKKDDETITKQEIPLNYYLKEENQMGPNGEIKKIGEYIDKKIYNAGLNSMDAMTASDQSYLQMVYQCLGLTENYKTLIDKIWVTLTKKQKEILSAEFCKLICQEKYSKINKNK